MTKISVIGGSGFIGTNLCERLNEKQIPFEIIDLKLSRRFPERTRIADIRNKGAIRRAISGDVVVNLAAVHTDDVSDASAYEETNVDGTRNIAEICDEKCIDKFIFTSSVAVYGCAPRGTDEYGKINPCGDYGRTKWEAEKRLERWYQCSPKSKSLLIVRPTVVFGEGNRGNVHNLLKQIASGRFLMIGNGRNCKSMAYVGNVAAFLEACIHSERRRETFNYVDTPDFDMNTLVRLVRCKLAGRQGVGPRLPKWLGLVIGCLFDLIARLTGRRFPISRNRVEKFTSETSFTSSRRELDGFEPPFTLQEGLDRTLRSEFVSPDPAREIFYTE